MAWIPSIECCTESKKIMVSMAIDMCAALAHPCLATVRIISAVLIGLGLSSLRYAAVSYLDRPCRF